MAANLARAHGHVHMVTGIGRRFHANAFLQTFLAQVCAPRPGRDGHVGSSTLGRHTHFFRAIKRDRADIAGIQLVGTHHFTAGFHDLLTGVRHVHAVNVRRIEEAVGVLFQAENSRTLVGLVGTLAFKHGQSVMQTVSKHVNLRFTPRHKFAVKPDKAIAIGH